MSSLEITSITNFILAAEVYFVAGLLFGKGPGKSSPALLWSYAMAALGTAALLGGLDHGFFELTRDGTLVRTILQRVTWVFIGLTTFFVLMTAGKQFFDKKYGKIFVAAASIQFVLSVVLSILFNNFLLVIVNYAPVMLFFLVMNSINLKSGRGNGAMTAGLVLTFIAAGIQQSKMQVLSPVNHNGIYHLVMMVAVVFFYYGGTALKGLKKGPS